MKKFLTYVLAVFAITTGLLVAQQSPSQSGKGKSQTSATKTGLVDINSASAEDLDKLPGIGKAYSAKIVAGRPYKRKDELVNKKVLPASVYDKIKDRIIAKQ